MSAPLTTIVGNLTADVELRSTANGTPVANFTIAATERVRDGDQWKDGNTVFLRCTLWREYAQHAAHSLRKGLQVIAVGTLAQRSWEAEDGSRRSSIEFDVQELGPALRFAEAVVSKTGAATSSAIPDAWAQLTDDAAAEPATRSRRAA